MPTYPDPNSRNGRVRSQIEVLSARREGFSASEVLGIDADVTAREIYRLRKAGKLFSVKVTHKRVRYFATQELADRWAAANHVTSPQDRFTIMPPRSRANWANDEPIITDKTKVTIAPRPRDRFDVDPGFERAITADWRARRLAEARA